MIQPSKTDQPSHWICLYELLWLVELSIYWLDPLLAPAHPIISLPQGKSLLGQKGLTNGMTKVGMAGWMDLTLSLGLVFTQKDDERGEYFITYVSDNNNKVDSNYSSYERKALAMGQPTLILDNIYMIKDLFYWPTINPWNGLWNQINSMANLLEGHCYFRNIILMVFIGSEPPICMQMDSPTIQFHQKRF